MTPENDAKLCAKYPLIFADRNKGPMESCMHWGLAVGDGWFDLIDVLCKSIQNHIDQSIKSLKFTKQHNEMVLATRAGDLTLFDNYFKHVKDEWRETTLKEILDPESDKSDDWGWCKGIRPEKPVIPQLVADQVKEKFAGLRFYCHGGDEYIRGLVDMAENLSYRICEDCGAPGKVVGRGWITVKCPAHYREDDAESVRERPFEWVVPTEEGDNE